MSPKAIENQPPIVFETEPITESFLGAFKKAVDSKHSMGLPPTFPTVFRKAEFEWLDRLSVDMRNLLHTEQEYIYLKPMKVGDRPTVSSRFTQWKEKRGMAFVTLETDVSVDGELRMVSKTYFLVRNLAEVPSAGG